MEEKLVNNEITTLCFGVHDEVSALIVLAIGLLLKSFFKQSNQNILYLQIARKVIASLKQIDQFSKDNFI